MVSLRLEGKLEFILLVSEGHPELDPILWDGRESSEEPLNGQSELVPSVIAGLLEVRLEGQAELVPLSPKGKELAGEPL